MMGFEKFDPGGYLNRLDQEQRAQELQEQRNREVFAQKVVGIYQYAEAQLATI